MSTPIHGDAEDGHGTEGNAYPHLNYQQLKKVNSSRQHLVTGADSTGRELADYLVEIASQVIKQCAPIEIRDWRKASAEQLTEKSQKQLQQILDQPNFVIRELLKRLPGPKQDYYPVLLELIVEGVLFDGNAHPTRTHSLREFNNRHLYTVSLSTVGMVEQADTEDRTRLTNEIEDGHEERRTAFESKDRDKEDDASLAPGQKARVLWNALRERNDIGHLEVWDDHDEKGAFIGVESSTTKDIVFRSADMPKVIAFFEEHRGMSVADLLVILDACLEAHHSKAEPRGWDPFWRIRQGRVLSFLLANVERIVRDLKTHTGVDYSDRLK